MGHRLLRSEKKDIGPLKTRRLRQCAVAAVAVLLQKRSNSVPMVTTADFGLKSAGVIA